MEIKKDKVQLFEEQPIRTAWVEDEEEWYFSIVDVVRVLTEQPNTDGARNYWKVLKNRIKEEGNELVTNCNQLKMRAQDGKMRLTDVANTEQLLRIIQSIPSKKAEPFKMWLAKVGRERIEESRELFQTPMIRYCLSDHERELKSDEGKSRRKLWKEHRVNLVMS